MSLKVFADLMSQPARAVTIFCRAANIQHELVNVRRIKIVVMNMLSRESKASAKRERER